MDSIINDLDSVTMNGEEAISLLPYLGIEPKVFPENEVSLVQGSETLKNDSNLRIPVAPQSFILTSVTHEKFNPTSIQWQNGNRFPGQHTLPVDARVVSVAEISLEDIMPKPKRLIEISIIGESGNVDAFMKDYDAGDSVYFIFPNSQKEVDFMLHRLGLYSVADNQLKLSVDQNSQKRDPKVPAFIPNPCSLRYLLTYCLDIRRAPGRPLLRVFAEYAKDEKEKRRLLELCSAQGVTEFTTFVRQAAISIVDFMIAFPSSNPPIDRLIELLPRLIPRPYSVSSHQSRQGRRIRFVYSLLNFSAVNGIQFPHYGICSEWMRSLQIGDKIQVMLKEPSKFRLPPISSPNLSILDIPLILIGPGTGVAPFASFFQKILAEKIKNGQSEATPKRYLFYGTRDLEKEFIFRDELESLNREGIITDLILCESQPKEDYTAHPKYVQDGLRERGKEIVDCIMNESTPQALIFACGDGKGLSKDLWACFIELFQTHLGKTSEEANVLLKELKEKERYIEDVWS
uniref:FAD-binding FR-type domain-containing protein n=1 Tax=Panagrolaimus sp. PS1159 TaxID=55785 RepID=A0AC35G5N7_9BILA